MAPWLLWTWTALLLAWSVYNVRRASANVQNALANLEQAKSNEQLAKRIRASYERLTREEAQRARGSEGGGRLWLDG